MWPNRWGWILLSTPLVLWVCGAGFLYVGAWFELQRHHESVAAHEAEMRQRSFPVYVTEAGERYHRESHRVSAPTSAIPHPLAMKRNLRPCQICKPIPIRTYPDPPEKNPIIAQRIRRANWTFGLVILSWVSFCYLPGLVKDLFFRVSP